MIAQAPLSGRHRLVNQRAQPVELHLADGDVVILEPGAALELPDGWEPTGQVRVLERERAVRVVPLQEDAGAAPAPEPGDREPENGVAGEAEPEAAPASGDEDTAAVSHATVRRPRPRKTTRKRG